MSLGSGRRTSWAGRMGSRRLRERPAGHRPATRRLGLESLEPRRILAGVGPLVISELMAVNDQTLADKDGDYSDWIEIHNPTPAAVNLTGWHVTDDPGDLSRWDFPAVSLEAGAYLIVFASGKNLADPAGELHTNFKLSGDGEYLALVQPDAVTISHEYVPHFPQQQADVSYGLSQGVVETTLIGAGATAKTLVPQNAALGTSWTELGFNDAAWTAGNTGVGFDLGADYDGMIATDVQDAMYGIQGSVYTRIPFHVSDPSAVDSLRLGMQYDDGFTAYLNGTPIAQRNSPTTPDWDSTATGEHGLPKTSTLTQDFDNAGTAYTLSRYSTEPAPEVLSGGPDGNFLRLLYDNVTWNYNRATFDRVLEGPASRVTADFNFRLDSPINPDAPADGFSFLLLPTSIYGTTGPGSNGSYVSEEPNLPNTFAIGFDTYPDDWGTNDVSAHWNGAEYSNVTLDNSQLDLDAGVFHHVHIELVEVEGGMQVSVTLTPDVYGIPGTPVTPIADLFIAGMHPYESRVEFSGRTGGLYMNADLDQIAVTFEPVATTLAIEDFDVSHYRGLLVAGANVLSIHGMNVRADDGDLLLVPTLTAAEDLPMQTQVETYFGNPTPGVGNLTAEDAPAEPPVFSRDGGTFAEPFALTLTAASPLATIRYTVDGSIPTETSPAYSSPLPLSTTARIRARAFQDGFSPSPVVSRGYIALDETVAEFTSDLPLIVFDTAGFGLHDTLLTPATAVVIEPGSDGRAAIAAEARFAGRAGLRIRGQSSQGFPKKSYAVETWTEGGADVGLIAAGEAADLPVSLLGLPEDSDWVLHGPYSDKALLRNYLAYNWSNAIGLYAPRTQLVEVFVNTGGGALNYSRDYVGLYVLMEKIKQGSERVDVQELPPGDNTYPDVTGGYIYKKDKDGVGDRPWNTLYGQTLRHVSPKADEITPQQQAYLEGYINQFESTLYGGNFADPDLGYSQYIDVDSFLDNWILVEMCKNIDGFRLSTYYHKDRNGKIEMGPIWDYDLSLGNADYLEGGISTGWYSDQLNDWDYPYWRRLFQDPEFEQRLVDRWSGYRQGEFSTTSLMSAIDTAAATVDEAQTRNFQQWNIMGSYVWPNAHYEGTWQDEIAWMKQWLADRVAWMDSQFVTAPHISPDGSAPGGGTPVTITAPAGTIYYTLDGSDPRAAGGGISPTARQYTGPIPMTTTALVRARALDASRGFEWSALTETPYHMAPLPSAGDLAIVEINYHPAAPTPEELAAATTLAASDFEFLELQNVSAHTVSLLGCRFTEGIQFTFDASAPTSLGPGQRVVVAANLLALSVRYSAMPNVAGPFERGSLDNSGEALRLVDASGADLVALAYSDSGAWPGRADGHGSSLEWAGAAGDPNDGSNWRSSTEYGGSPGYAGVGPLVDVVINEVLSHTDLPEVDAVELYNTTGASIDLSYWWLSDSEDYRQFQIPAGTVLPAHGYLTFDENDFNRSGGTAPGDFALDGAHGDEVWLLAGNVWDKPTRFVDHVTFPAQANGESFGRWPNGAGELSPMTAPTLGPVSAQPRIGAANSGPRIGPIVISEVNYSPSAGGYEFVELFNATFHDVPLYDPAHPANCWQFGGVSFAFPAGTVLPAHRPALVVATEPAVFRATYDVPADVPVFGPYSGMLDNSGERLQLLYPDQPPQGEPAFVPNLLGDEVHYGSQAPWPVSANGAGNSLHRVSSVAWGNDPVNWYAASPTPGRVAYNAAPWLKDVPAVVTTAESVPYTFDADATDPDLPAQSLTFSLLDQPPGAAIDPATGVFQWTPTAAQGPADYTFTVRVNDGIYFTDQSLTINVTGAAAPADIRLTSVVASGAASLTVTYVIEGGPVVPFQIGFYRSSDAIYGSGDIFAGSASISAGVDRCEGTHTKTFPIGSGTGQVALPGAGAEETDFDYYLLGLADCTNTVSETARTGAETNNAAVFTGMYHVAGGAVIVHGTSGADVFKVLPATAVGMRVETAGTAINYTGTDVAGIRARGHAGDDQFQFTWNSGFQTAPGTTLSALFIGGAGTNAATLWGSTSAALLDTANVSPTYTTVTGPGYYVLAKDLKTSTLYGQGGPDKAYLYDSSAADAFHAYPSYCTLGDGTFANRVEDYPNVYANALSQGADTATFHAARGNGVDQFSGSPTYAVLTGLTTTGRRYYARADAFETMVGESLDGESDVATLFDSEQTTTDTQYAFVLDAAQRYGEIQGGAGAGTIRSNRFFTTVVGSRDLGSDRATLYGSPAADRIQAKLNAKEVWLVPATGTAFKYRASQVQRVDAYSAAGQQDIAEFYDSAGDDLFTGGPDASQMTTPAGVLVTATGFRYVSAFSTSTGNDTAVVTGKVGIKDKFVGQATQATLGNSDAQTDPKYLLWMQNFERVTAYGQSADGDWGTLSGSAAQDTFTSDFALQAGSSQRDPALPYATFAGTGFSNTASGFNLITATAGAGDVAELYAAAAADVFSASPLSAVMYRKDAAYPNGMLFYHEAKGFGSVTAHGAAGAKAKVNDATTRQVLLELSGNWAKLSNRDSVPFSVVVQDFDDLTAAALGSLVQQKKKLQDYAFALHTSGSWIDV